MDVAQGSAGSAARHERGPAVLLVGGLLTSPVWYWPLRRHFMDRGAARFSVAPVWLYHWLAAAFRGPEASTSVVADAIERLHAEDGRPILVVGHSGGGILARLALSREPYGRARQARPESVGAVVTVGSPHLATRFGGTIGREGLRALRFLAAQADTPGIPDPWTLLTIGGDVSASAARAGRLRREFSAACYRALLGPAGRGKPGDGMVPFQCAVIPERQHLALEGIAHAPFLGGPWYFSNEAMDRWWDPAVAAWIGALSGTPSGAMPGTAIGPADQADLQSGT
jgi:pimeloyl-ACP methyl ester carboxylesterase